MKALKFMAVSLCLMVSVMSNAVTPVTVNSLEIFTKVNEKVFTLSAKTYGDGKFNIQIVDDEENIVFSKKMKAIATFEQKYNLKDFDIGNYSLVIEDASKIITQPFVVTKTEVAVDSEAQIFVMKPQFDYNSDSGLLSVNWVKGDESDCKLILTGKYKSILFKEKIANDGVINRGYDLSKLTKGTYYITIKDGNYTYDKTIEIE